MILLFLYKSLMILIELDVWLPVLFRRGSVYFLLGRRLFEVREEILYLDKHAVTLLRTCWPSLIIINI